MKKKLLVTLSTLSAILMGTGNVYAGSRINTVDIFTMDGAYADVVVVDNDLDVDATSDGDVTVDSYDLRTFKNSAFQTGVSTGSKNFNVKGRNVDLSACDGTQLDGSIAGTVISDIKKSFNVFSK